MSVRQRKWTDAKGKVRTAWVVDIVFALPTGQETRVTKTSPVNTKLGAQEYERRLRTELLTGNYKRQENLCPTLDEFFPTVLKEADADNKESTADWKSQTYRLYLQPTLGKLRLSEIDAGAVLDLKTTLKKSIGKRTHIPLSKKTQNNALGLLVRVFNLALKHGKVMKTPEIVLHRGVQSAWAFLDFSEAERLIAASHQQERTMVTVAIRTGLRVGELVALRWADVDLVARKLTVRQRWYKGKFATPKGGRTREVPLSAQTVAELTAQKARTFMRGDLVFLSDAGKLLKPQRAYKRLLRLCRKAGIKSVSYHDLRHTFASHLVMRNVVPLKQVQEWMGHQSITQTEKYAHLAPGANTLAIDHLDGATLAQHGSRNEKTLKTSEGF
jgi:integrase